MLLQHVAVCCSVMQYVATYRDRSTGWRRLIGSPKLQIIFHKRANKYRSLLRKMTYKDKGSYESSPPSSKECSGKRCVCVCCCSVLQLVEVFGIVMQCDAI